MIVGLEQSFFTAEGEPNEAAYEGVAKVLIMV
jgi:hypothetical protein